MTEADWRWGLTELKMLKGNQIIVPAKKQLQVTFGAGNTGVTYIEDKDKAHIERGFLVHRCFGQGHSPYLVYVDLDKIISMQLSL